jgi:hypothetical protein
MANEVQNAQNHTRIDPLFHRVLVPILMFHLLWSIWRLYRDPSWVTGEALLLAFGLTILGLFSRLNALRAQDRVIRLEEQLRLERLGQGASTAKLLSLTMPQIVALRFASDAEFPALLDRVAAGQLKAPKDIKAAIQTWRPDFARV